MKIPVLTFFLVLSFTGFSQTLEFDSLLAKGKAEFKKDYDDQDYTAATGYLEKAVALKPENAEAHYFLGYAYSRINSKDGKGMIDMNLPLLQKTSAEFETVNRLTPKYSAEIVVLDPYAKLTSEWGSMAMSYWHNNKKDSAVWAFKQGKQKGGFDEFMLAVNRNVLDLCSKNTILISSGDSFTILLWYLQIVEGYRKDVSVIDISLLNTIWYPRYLTEQKSVQFDKPQSEIDTLEYCFWKEKTVKIGNFSWIVKPSYYDQYLLRGDRLFLSILKKNNFERDVYFTTSFMESERLSLGDYLKSYILIDKISPKDQRPMPADVYKKEITKILQIADRADPNIETDLRFIYLIRYNILNRITGLIEVDDKVHARELKALMDEYISEQKYPYDDYMKIYTHTIKNQLR